MYACSPQKRKINQNNNSIFSEDECDGKWIASATHLQYLYTQNLPTVKSEIIKLGWDLKKTLTNFISEKLEVRLKSVKLDFSLNY